MPLRASASVGLGTEEMSTNAEQQPSAQPQAFGCPHTPGNGSSSGSHASSSLDRSAPLMPR